MWNKFLKNNVHLIFHLCYSYCFVSTSKNIQLKTHVQSVTVNEMAWSCVQRVADFFVQHSSKRCFKAGLFNCHLFLILQQLKPNWQHFYAHLNFFSPFKCSLYGCVHHQKMRISIKSSLYMQFSLIWLNTTVNIKMLKWTFGFWTLRILSLVVINSIHVIFQTINVSSDRY